MIILLITNKKVFNYLEYNIEVEEVFGKVAEELDDKTIWRHALTTGVSVSAILFLSYKIRADVLSSALIPLIR